MSAQIKLLCFLLVLCNVAFADIKIGYAFVWDPVIKQPAINDWTQFGFGYHRINVTWAPFKSISPYVGLFVSGFPQKSLWTWSEIATNTDTSIKYEKLYQTPSVSSLGAGFSIGYLLKIQSNCFIDIYNNTGYGWYFFSHDETIKDWNNVTTGKWSSQYTAGDVDMEFGLRPIIRFNNLFISVGAGYKYSTIYDHEPPLGSHTLRSNNPAVPPVNTVYTLDEIVSRYTISGVIFSMSMCYSLSSNTTMQKVKSGGD